MENMFSVKINLSTKELEIVGSQEFIEEKFDKYLYLLHSEFPSLEKDDSKRAKTPTKKNGFPVSFGEYINSFPNDQISDIDRFLIGASFVQEQNEGNTFKTMEVSSLLKEFGIKISNPSDVRARNVTKKHIFKQSGNDYKLSVKGQEYLRSLKE